jgi:hypothetical protein
MATVTNIEVVTLNSEFAIIKFDNDTEMEIDLIYLPKNIKIGTVLRLNIAPIALPHTKGWSDYEV